jgi:hypothetical protein
MSKKLSLLLLVLGAVLLASCWPFESYPRQETRTTTTATCPAGTQLQNDRMCRAGSVATLKRVTEEAPRGTGR